MAQKQKSKADYEDRLKGYREVPDRIVEFYAKYPNGILTQASAPEIISLEVPTFDEDGMATGTAKRTFIQYTAAAYRQPDDPYPGIGTVWEPFPGSTPYTKDSEMMNAETSAWGRALVAVGILSKDEPIASRNEVQARSAPPDEPSEPKHPISDTEIQILAEMALAAPVARGKSVDWAVAAVRKRVEYFVKKKADDPVAEAFLELETALGGPENESVMKAKAALEAIDDAKAGAAE